VPRIKTMLNRMVDDIVHPKGAPNDIPTMLADEALHTLIEGEFRPDKFLRYTLLPQLRVSTRKKQLRRRKPRKNRPLLPLPLLQQNSES